MNQIFDEEDRSKFKLKTFRRISYLLNKINLICDFAFVDDSGYNRNLNPGCKEVVFYDIEIGSIYLKIDLQTLEIDSIQEISKYLDLIRSIIYDKLDITQIEREYKLINIINNNSFF